MPRKIGLRNRLLISGMFHIILESSVAHTSHIYCRSEHLHSMRQTVGSHVYVLDSADATKAMGHRVLLRGSRLLPRALVSVAEGRWCRALPLQRKTSFLTARRGAFVSHSNTLAHVHSKYRTSEFNFIHVHSSCLSRRRAVEAIEGRDPFDPPHAENIRRPLRQDYDRPDLSLRWRKNSEFISRVRPGTYMYSSLAAGSVRAEPRANIR